MRYYLLAALGAALAVTAMDGAAARPIDGQYICVFKANSVSRANVRAEAERAGGNGLRHVYDVALKGFAVNMAAQGVAELRRRNPNIAYCEQDQLVTVGQADPFEFRTLARRPGGGGTQPAQTTPWGISRVNGGTGDFSTSTRRAFVIDSGIDLDHPDLRVDTAASRNFVPRESTADDSNGHGTHVAGTIGALNNSIGVIGVAPGARLVAVRVLDRRGSGAYSDVIAGVNYVAGTGIAGDVANMSLGGPPSDALDEAVRTAAARGIAFVLAAGNESTEAGTRSPARTEGANVYTVSSFARTGDTWSSFSNFGNPPVDYAEPGSSIPSTYKDGGYSTLSGTSMAAPHLAGILYAGAVRTGGSVNGDPDNKPDPIGVR